MPRMTEHMAARAERSIRMGMVGGGQDAFIGAVHRMAAQLGRKYAAGGWRVVVDAREGDRQWARAWA